MAYTTIDDPSAYFQTLLYTGDGNDDRNLVNTGNSDLQPDWIWIKDRDNVRSHEIYDSSRGATKRIQSDNTGAESTQANNLQAFQSDGFQTGSGPGTNASSQKYVAWQWKSQGGSTVSNSDGSITSTVQANTTAGFSIVSWQGNATNPSTIGHGLNQKPDVILLKNRDTSGTNWIMYHSANTSAPETDYLILDSTNATADSANVWSDTEPTSSVFTVGSAGSVNNNGDDFITYCFHSVKGFSKMGSYTGNGNSDGPMVFCGFSPSWLMIKRTNDTGDWNIIDTTRDTINTGTNSYLYAHTTDAEQTGSAGFDILSNGFKIRNTHSRANASGSNYIYMCFASSPLVGSDGTPTTAR